MTILPPGLLPEEEWERRRVHREACIAAVKRSDPYRAVAQHPARPLSPDPRRPEVSKRAWEKSVRHWRMKLKALAADVQGPMHVVATSPWFPSCVAYVPVSTDYAAFVPQLRPNGGGAREVAF